MLAVFTIAGFAPFLSNGTAARVGEALRKFGYAHVTVDLLGYRRGSTNEGLAPPGEEVKATSPG